MVEIKITGEKVAELAALHYPFLDIIKISKDGKTVTLKIDDAIDLKEAKRRGHI